MNRQSSREMFRIAHPSRSSHSTMNQPTFFKFRLITEDFIKSLLWLSQFTRLSADRGRLAFHIWSTFWVSRTRYSRGDVLSNTGFNQPGMVDHTQGVCGTAARLEGCSANRPSLRFSWVLLFFSIGPADGGKRAKLARIRVNDGRAAFPKHITSARLIEMFWKSIDFQSRIVWYCCTFSKDFDQPRGRDGLRDNSQVILRLGWRQSIVKQRNLISILRRVFCRDA
jgi:hypothetical protein